MLKYKNKEFVFGSTLVKGSKNVAEWEFEGDASTIAHMQAGCGCTANIKIEGSKIVADYTDIDGPKIQEKIIDSHYPTGTLSFDKSIYIYYKDGKDLYVQNGMNKNFNKDKSYDQLRLKGKVCLKPDGDCD